MDQHPDDDKGWVNLDDLQLSLQLRPELSAHVRRLARVLDDCPPILVARDSFVLIDGYMRVRAARARGRARLPVTWTSGTGPDLLEQAIIANAQHGAPLNMAQRKAGAARLLESAPGWSNGRIAKACGVSEPVVRRLRPGPSPTNVDSSLPHPGPSPTKHRLGADGKSYPVGHGAQDLARAVLAEHPESSDRAIAEAAKLSATTVGRLRKQMIADEPGPTPDVTPEVEQHRVASGEANRTSLRWRWAAENPTPMRRLLHALRAVRALVRPLLDVLLRRRP